MPASLTADQNRSKYGSAGGLRPNGVIGAAGRMQMMCAPRSSAHASSATAQFGSDGEMYGAAKIRSAL